MPSGPAVRRQSRPLVTYAYLASVAHSGSTLLASLFSAHPSIATVGEFGATFRPEGRCSCGTTYRECSFWTDWQARAIASGIPFRLGNLGINLAPSQDGG